MGKHKHEWRELEHNEKKQYAMAMRRLDLGTWGYAVSTLRAIHLTTREGNDNTPKVFAKDLRKLIGEFRAEGYELQYDGTLGYTPRKHLLHWHGLIRVKGGYFPVTRRMLGDRWNRIHGAFVVKMTVINRNRELKDYILKHIMSEYVGEDDGIRNRFLFSRGWMRPGWKAVQDIAKGWLLGGQSPIFMTKERWDMVNKILEAWAKKETKFFFGKIVKGERCGYLFMGMGRIREASGGALVPGTFEYYDY